MPTSISPSTVIIIAVPEDHFFGFIELSQDYLFARYPGDKSPWDIYDEETILTTKSKIEKAFGSTKSILLHLLPNRSINLSDCLTKAISNPKLKKIYEEMKHYFD